MFSNHSTEELLEQLKSKEFWTEEEERLLEELLLLRINRDHVKQEFNRIGEVTTAMMGLDFSKRLNLSSLPIDEKNLLNFIALNLNMVNEELGIKVMPKQVTNDMLSILSGSTLIFVTNTNGVITFVNNEIEDLYGLKRETLYTMHISQFIDEYDQIIEALNNKTLLNDMTVNMVSNAEQNLQKQVIVKKSFLDDEEYSIIYILKDEIESGETKEKIELAKLSHDILSPLNSMTALMNLLIKNNDESKIYLDLLLNSKNSLSEAAKSTLMGLGFSKNSDPIEEINFSLLIKEILNVLAYEEGFDEVHFSITNHNKFPFYSYTLILRSIIQNFITNSIKYRKRNYPGCYTEITINDRENNQVEIQIKDNGIGIESQYLSKIFEREYRIPTIVEGNKYLVPGNGLGLYLVKKQVERLNGSIDVSSSLGEGTTFTLVIPGKKV